MVYKVVFYIGKLKRTKTNYKKPFKNNTSSELRSKKQSECKLQTNITL